MRSSSDQRMNDAAEPGQTEEVSPAEVEYVEEDGGADESEEEEFEGFDGSWDYEWVASIEAFMEAMPWTWIALAVFIAGLAYSYRNNHKS